MSNEEIFKKIMAKMDKMVGDVRNNQTAIQTLEKQFGQFARAQNPHPQGGLPSNTDPNPRQVNTVGSRSGLQLEEVAPRKKALEMVSRYKLNSAVGPSDP